MVAPVGRKAHIGERYFLIIIKQIEQPLRPLGSRADFGQPEVADRHLQANSFISESWRNMPKRIFVFPWNRRICAEDPIPDARMVRT